MNSTPRRLTLAIASQFLLLGCISSTGIGKPPGDDDAGVQTNVGGKPSTSQGGAGTTGGATSVVIGMGGSLATGGARATGGAPVVVGVGGGATTGGVAATGGTSFGTSSTCDFTNVACTQGVCSTVKSYEQTTCLNLLTCLQNNSACITAADPLCSTKAQYSQPACTDWYSLSEEGRTLLTTFIKCVCGIV